MKRLSGVLIGLLCAATVAFCAWEDGVNDAGGVGGPGGAPVTGDIDMLGYDIENLDTVRAEDGENLLIQGSTTPIGDIVFYTGGAPRFGLSNDGHIIPFADDVFDLGSVERRWRDLYVGPGTIYIGESALTITNDQVVTFNTNSPSQIDFYAKLSASNQFTAAQEIVGKIGVTNSNAPAGTYHNLFVQASTNGPINHGIAVHCGDMSEGTASGALHVYANTNGPGSAIHIFRISKSATGGGLMRLEDNSGADVITADADAAEVKVIGQFIAQQGTGSGVSPNSAADSFVVDSSALNSGISITSTNGGNGSIFFGTLDKGNNALAIQYISSIDRGRIKLNNVTKMEILAASVDVKTNLIVDATATADVFAFPDGKTITTDGTNFVFGFTHTTNVVYLTAPADGS